MNGRNDVVVESLIVATGIASTLFEQRTRKRNTEKSKGVIMERCVLILENEMHAVVVS